MRTIVFIALFTGLLAGCAPGKPATEEKIGMHFDAVLEFVVEYPLSWQKDRRLPFGSHNGEVRWDHPGYPDVLLKVQSTVNDGKGLSEDEAFNRLTAEYPGMDPLLVEELDLNGTMATHIEGQVRQLHIESYILSINNRSYVITLESPDGDQDDFQDLMNEFVHSFKAIPAN